MAVEALLIALLVIGFIEFVGWMSEAVGDHQGGVQRILYAASMLLLLAYVADLGGI